MSSDPADTDGASPRRSRLPRAGRDLASATAVGVALGALMLISLLTIRQLFVGVVAIAVALATWELYNALRRDIQIRASLIPLLFGGQAMVWLSWPFGVRGLLAAFVVTVLVCLVWRLSGGAAGYVRDVTASLFTAAYVPLFASFAALLVIPPDGAARVLTFMITVVATDTGGYAAGVLRGRHPMVPTISPNKTWEGFAGSIVIGTAGATLAMLFLLDGRLWHGIVFGAAVVLTATFGDLIESLIKRDLGTKDMGTLLPGHGGLMDRLDSMLPSAVVSWLLLGLLLPV